jgi:hypothetical protein
MSGLEKIAKISILLLLGAKFSFAQPALPPKADPPLAESIPHFDIYAYDQNLAQKIKIDLEFSYQKISSFLDDTLEDVISVYVVDSDQEFRSLVGEGFPDWGIACAIPSHNTIVLKSPSHFDYHAPLSQLVTHELAHIFLGNLAKGVALPRWLDEGFAMHQSQEWRFGQDIAVARAVLTGLYRKLFGRLLSYQRVWGRNHPGAGRLFSLPHQHGFSILKDHWIELFNVSA